MPYLTRRVRLWLPMGNHGLGRGRNRVRATDSGQRMDSTTEAGGGAGSSTRRWVDDAFAVGVVGDGPAPLAPVPSPTRASDSPVEAFDLQRPQWVLRAGDSVAIVFGFLAMALATGYHHLGGDRLAFTVVSAAVLGLWAM